MNVCPICDGSKRLRYLTPCGLSKREVETECWACRGTGEVRFREQSVGETTVLLINEITHKKFKVSEL